MTRLREILAYVESRPHRIAPFRELRIHFHADLTGLKVAIDEHLLVIQGACYTITEAGLTLLATDAVFTPTEKICYQCERTLSFDHFWKNPSSGDGLFDYCITCGERKRRKRKEMEANRKQAEHDIVGQAAKLSGAALRWDSAVLALVSAWREMVAVDLWIREHLKDLGSDNDSGRMHARVTFPRASFALNLALADAGFPISGPLLREVPFPSKLADYVGLSPHLDYIEPSVTEENRSDEGQEDGGPQTGQPEQGDQGSSRDDPRRDGEGGGRGLSAASVSKAKPRTVSRTGR